ncbi:unnamed protein product [Microthlaspi erraticum]|uniref:IST1-like protein n=1 Tax=Microthlaspi erraticum TaxID=1685480 RepID=A0A6D2IAR7_9BRAS|nr:unnamed protein product [Microthlaspi erraticum]
MFDGLFKPKFYTKCKTLVKITKTRVDAVKRKKLTVCKYLKNDIVDLLKNSLDYNAYGRAEGLIEEKRRLSCYELLEQFCVCVASNVSLLQKSSKCPEECREAIASLVYAAARVSEVPELRDLRSLFAERYANSLDHFVNPQLVERFKAEPPSKEMKVELLQEIAREYSIKWDAKPLEKRLYTPPPSSSPSPPQHHHIHRDEAKDNNPEKKTIGNRGRLSFQSRKEESLDDNDKDKEPIQSRSETCAEDVEAKPFYYRFMPAPYKIEKQESLPEKMTISHLNLMPDDTDSPTKPRSVRRRMANPPRDSVETEDSVTQSSKNMSIRSESTEKAGGEGTRRMSRRTASWQPKGSNVPDFDEVAARVDALTRN